MLRLSRFQFTIRSLMLAVAIVAVGLACWREFVTVDPVAIAMNASRYKHGGLDFVPERGDAVWNDQHGNWDVTLYDFTRMKKEHYHILPNGSIRKAVWDWGE